MGQYYVGLDVHSRQSAFVIEDVDGRVIAQGEVPTTAAGFEHLRVGYHLPPGTPVPLETGTVAFFAARQLRDGTDALPAGDPDDGSTRIVAHNSPPL